MKMVFGFKRTASMIFALLLMAGGVANNSYAAIAGEGDYCWNVKITEDEAGPVSMPPMLVKFHIMPLGNGSILNLSGKVNVTGDSPFYIMGVASATPTTIVANLATSQVHADGWRDTGNMRVTLNAATLAGSFYELGLDFGKTNHTFDQRYTAGTLTPRVCP